MRAYSARHALHAFSRWCKTSSSAFSLLLLIYTYASFIQSHRAWVLHYPQAVYLLALSGIRTSSTSVLVPRAKCALRPPHPRTPSSARETLLSVHVPQGYTLRTGVWNQEKGVRLITRLLPLTLLARVPVSVVPADMRNTDGADASVSEHRGEHLILRFTIFSVNFLQAATFQTRVEQAVHPSPLRARVKRTVPTPLFVYSQSRVVRNADLTCMTDHLSICFCCIVYHLLLYTFVNVVQSTVLWTRIQNLG